TELIATNFASIRQIYFGDSFENQQGKGFDDYLKAVDGGEALVSETLLQMNATQQAIENIPAGRLSEQIANNNYSAAEAVHTELSRLTRFIKSDMSSMLGISITYSSGDGD